MMRYALLPERGEDGGWGAYCPDLEGLVIAADSREEVLALAPEVIAEYVSELRRDGIILDDPHFEAVTIEISAA